VLVRCHATRATILGPLGDPAQMMRMVIHAELQHLAHCESSQKGMRQLIPIQRWFGPALDGGLNGPRSGAEPRENRLLSCRQVLWGRLHAGREAACLAASSEGRLIRSAQLGKVPPGSTMPSEQET